MQSNRHLTFSLKIVHRAMRWLTGLLWLTKEEQQQAGILYPNEQRYG